MYQFMFNTPLSLINSMTDIAYLVQCFYITTSGTGDIKCSVLYGESTIELQLIFSEEVSYTAYKQLASLTFTTDTIIKITIKTDE